MRFLVPDSFFFFMVLIHLMMLLIAFVFIYRLSVSIVRKIIYMIIASSFPIVGSVSMIVLCSRQIRQDWENKKLSSGHSQNL